MKEPLFLSVCKQLYLNGVFTVSLWHFIYESYQMMFPFFGFFEAVIRSPLTVCRIPISHWNSPYGFVCVEQNHSLSIRQYGRWLTEVVECLSVKHWAREKESEVTIRGVMLPCKYRLTLVILMVWRHEGLMYEIWMCSSDKSSAF